MICICFGTNEKWTSKLVRWATNSEYSHTWIEFPCSVRGGLWVLHSGKDGVVDVPQERIRKAYPKYVTYECLVDLSDGFLWARSSIGAGYDYGVVWNGLLLVLYGATKWEWLYRIVARNASKFSCSEWGSSLLKNSVAVESTSDIDTELTTSGALMEFCDTSHNFRLREDSNTSERQRKWKQGMWASGD